MGDYGAKVAKQNYDVRTALDKNLVLKSDINIFKVSADGSGTVNASSSVTVAHGFSYIPYFLVFIEDTSGKMRIANGSGFVVSEEFRGHANTTNVIIENMDAANNKKYYYYIHYDPQAT